MTDFDGIRFLSIGYAVENQVMAEQIAFSSASLSLHIWFTGQIGKRASPLRFANKFKYLFHRHSLYTMLTFKFCRTFIIYVYYVYRFFYTNPSVE